MARRAARIDGNQRKIVKFLKQIPGISISLTHMVGRGFPDIVVGFRGKNYLFELKDPAQPPSGRILTPDEDRWHRYWKGQSEVVETEEQILMHIGAIDPLPDLPEQTEGSSHAES